MRCPTSEDPRSIVLLALAAIAVITALAAAPAASPALASETICETVIDSPAFRYIHRVGTGAYVSNPGALASACAVEDHPTDTNLKRVTVSIVGEGSTRVTAVAAYNTQTQSVGSAVIDDTRDKPRPISIEHGLFFFNHRALVLSDPYTPVVTTASATADTYDTGIGSVTGFPAPVATEGYDVCVWITEKAFGAGCSAFESDCVERSAEASDMVCNWIEN